MQTRNRRRFRWLVGLTASTAAALVAVALVTVPPAAAATLFSDDFEDRDRSGWSTNGGSWSVVSDGSQVLRQGSTSSDAKAVAGSSGWTDYAVQVRVKPESFNGSDRHVEVLARVQSSTSYYYLALRNGNRVELGKRSGGSFTALAGATMTVSTGTWHTLRLEVFGSQVRGYVDGDQVGSASDSAYGSGRVGVATYYAAARFDEVAVSDQPGPGPTGSPTSSPTQSPTSSPTSSPTASPTGSPPPAPADGPIGWASQQGGTTGGAGGETVTVTDGATLAQRLEDDGPLVIRVQGMLSMPDKMNDVHSDKTIVGVGSNSGLTGGGLNISSGYHNIIIRNLHFRDWRDDGINVQNSAHHIWVDHNSFANGYDGAVDVKRGSDFVTVSWNHFFDHQKLMLLGHDDGNGAQDRGHLRVTYHHNWFDGSAERHPRVRFGNPVHVFNNYYDAVGVYGVASTTEAGVLVEGNYFENTATPCVRGYGDSPEPGGIVERNNHFVSSGTCASGGSVSPIPYSYRLDNASDVKSIVMANSGPR